MLHKIHDFPLGTIWIEFDHSIEFIILFNPNFPRSNVRKKGWWNCNAFDARRDGNYYRHGSSSKLVHEFWRQTWKKRVKLFKAALIIFSLSLSLLPFPNRENARYFLYQINKDKDRLHSAIPRKEYPKPIDWFRLVRSTSYW